MDVSSNIFSDDIFGEDCVTIPNPSSVLKIPNLSLDNAMTQATNKDSSTKLSKNIEYFQNVPTIDILAEANDNRPSNVPKVWFVHYSGLLQILNHKRLFRLSNYPMFSDCGVSCVNVLHNSLLNPQKTSKS